MFIINDEKHKKLIEIASAFNGVHQPQDAEEIKSGLINDTYWVMDIKENKYLLQLINTHVFKQPKELMENIQRVLDHQKKTSLYKNSLTLVISKDRKPYTIYEKKDKEGHVKEEQYWRMYHYIENTSFENNPSDLHSNISIVAKAFGEFHKEMSTFENPATLHETIKDFHSLQKYYNQYKNAFSTADDDKKASCQKECDFVESLATSLIKTHEGLKARGMPVRVVHNDAKPSNVLITNEGGIVIDLDTVMPGYVLYDLGDMIRTMATTAKEDEEKIDTVSIDSNLFKTLFEAYLGEVSESLTKLEKQHIVFAGQYIIFELGVRFLADYLAGDVYFKVNSPKQNLRRARVQFALVASIIEQKDELETIVKKLS